MLSLGWHFFSFLGYHSISRYPWAGCRCSFSEGKGNTGKKGGEGLISRLVTAKGGVGICGCVEEVIPYSGHLPASSQDLMTARGGRALAAVSRS